MDCAQTEWLSNADYLCNTCEKRALCGFCPAFFALENGAEDDRSEYLCAMGHSRFHAIMNADITPRDPGGRHVSRSKEREEASVREA